MDVVKDDSIWCFIIATFIALDSFKLYLSFRNIVAVDKMRTPPTEMEGLMTEGEYQRLRTKTYFETYAIMTDILIDVVIRIAKLVTPYYPYVWNKSAEYSSSLTSRAIWFSALDVFLSRCMFLPLVFISAVATAQTDPFLVIINMVLNTMIHTLAAALGAFMLVLFTDRFGPKGFTTLIAAINVLSLLVVAFYVQYVIPSVMKRLPDDHAGRDVQELAKRVGYPEQRIFVDVDKEALPNAYFSSALGAKMIIITETLITTLSPGLMVSVVAHELGHWYYCHPTFQYLFSLGELTARCTLWLQTYGSNRINRVFHLPTDTHPVVPVYLSVYFLWPIFQDVYNGVFSLVGTWCEFIADNYCVQQGLASSLRQALLTMTAKIQGFPLFDSWFSAWFLGHPTTLQRIRRIDRNLQQIPS